MSSEIEIGVSTIVYTPHGEIAHASFRPTMEISVEASILKQLTDVKPGDADYLRRNSEIAMATWFSRTNEIELADRDSYEIVGTVLDCLKYPDGTTQSCQMKFAFRKIGGN